MDYFTSACVLVALEGLALLAYLLSKKLLTGDRFKRFLAVWLICVGSSGFPLFTLGMLFGAPSTFLAAVLITFFLDKGSK